METFWPFVVFGATWLGAEFAREERMQPMIHVLHHFVDRRGPNKLLRESPRDKHFKLFLNLVPRSVLHASREIDFWLLFLLVVGEVHAS